MSISHSSKSSILYDILVPSYYWSLPLLFITKFNYHACFLCQGHYRKVLMRLLLGLELEKFSINSPLCQLWCQNTMSPHPLEFLSVFQFLHGFEWNSQLKSCYMKPITSPLCGKWTYLNQRDTRLASHQFWQWMRSPQQMVGDSHPGKTCSFHLQLPRKSGFHWSFYSSSSENRMICPWWFITSRTYQAWCARQQVVSADLQFCSLLETLSWPCLYPSAIRPFWPIVDFPPDILFSRQAGTPFLDCSYSFYHENLADAPILYIFRGKKKVFSTFTIYLMMY